MALDYGEFEELLNGFKLMQKKHEQFIKDFLVEMGLRTMRQTKKLTPVDTGNLRNRWELSSVYRKGDNLFIRIYNPADYASHVEDGHMQRARFVPGSFFGNKFEYIPGYPFGMVLTNKWIPGHHMARISITKIENEIPKRYEKALVQFMRGLGVAD